MSQYFPSGKVQPVIKWAGGKEQELKFIIPTLPQRFTNYFEPFVGGGSVFSALQPLGKVFLNDKSHGLVNMYKVLAGDGFYECFAELLGAWDFISSHVKQSAAHYINLYREYSQDAVPRTEMQQHAGKLIEDYVPIMLCSFRNYLHPVRENLLANMQRSLAQKIHRMKMVERKLHLLKDCDVLENIESGLKSGFYTACRSMYNDLDKCPYSSQERGVLFFFVHNMAYSGMFRYNSEGRFNVPYGGIGYNRKSFTNKLEFLRSDFFQKKLSSAIIENMDFESFLNKYEPQEQDFVFLDPPYDSGFSTYLQNSFTHEDHKRLAQYLLHKCKAQWMLVIKNTPFIFKLYSDKGLNVQMFNKKYLVSFMNRNDKHAEHLLIRSYSGSCTAEAHP